MTHTVDSELRTVRVLSADSVVVRDDSTRQTLLLRALSESVQWMPATNQIRHQLNYQDVLQREGRPWSVHPWHGFVTQHRLEQPYAIPIQVVLQHLQDLAAAGFVPSRFGVENLWWDGAETWMIDCVPNLVSLRQLGVSGAASAWRQSREDVERFLSLTLEAQHNRGIKLDSKSWTLLPVQFPPPIPQHSAGAVTSAAQPARLLPSIPSTLLDPMPDVSDALKAPTLEPTELGTLIGAVVQGLKGRLRGIVTPRSRRLLMVGVVSLMASIALFGLLVPGGEQSSEANPATRSDASSDSLMDQNNSIDGDAAVAESRPSQSGAQAAGPSAQGASEQLGQDPAAAAVNLWNQRQWCLAHADCVEYAQPGSAIASLDQQLLQSQTPIAAVSAISATVTSDMGQVVLVQVQTANGTSSVLVVRTEVGWRLRDVFG